MRVCRVCLEEFIARPGKPGFVDVCEMKSCVEAVRADVPLLKAEVSWEDKHTPIIRVTDARTANRFNAKMRRRGVLSSGLAQSAKNLNRMKPPS